MADPDDRRLGIVKIGIVETWGAAMGNRGMDGGDARR
jgi:hypothetical protein